MDKKISFGILKVRKTDKGKLNLDKLEFREPERFLIKSNKDKNRLIDNKSFFRLNKFNNFSNIPNKSYEENNKINSDKSIFRKSYENKLINTLRLTKFSNSDNLAKFNRIFSVVLVSIFMSLLIISQISLISAIDDLFALQGNVKEGGANLRSGNITITVYDAAAGGSMIHNSTWKNNVSNGKYDILIGNDAANELHLNYGQVYYFEVIVNGEDFDFDGNERQVFQSGVGNVSVSDLDFATKVVLTNNSVTFDEGQNITMGTGGWFHGFVNWSWIQNAPALSLLSDVVSMISGNRTEINNAITGNATEIHGDINANMTIAVIQTILDSGDLNLASLNTTGLLNASGGFAVTGDADFNGGWQAGGTSIIGGNVFARTIYVYNITSVGVSNLNINASIIPGVDFDNQFTIGNATSRWSQGFFSGNLYSNGSISGTDIKTGNLYDADGTDFFDETGCGTSATVTAIDATGAVSCSAIGIATTAITGINAGTDITADLEEEAHCSEHDSTDVDCSGETILVVDDSHNHVITNIDAFTSAALYGQISDETGSASGSPLAVFNVNPTLTGATFAGIIADNDDMVFEADANSDGSNKFSFTDGASIEIASLSEAGALQLDSTLSVDGGTVTLGGTGAINGLDSVDATGENTIEALIFDTDAESITGVWEVADDTNFDIGTDANWHIEYDEGVDNQLLFTTTQTAAIATTDPLFEILVGLVPTANQQVFGIAKGSQSVNTPLLTIDEGGDFRIAGTTYIAGSFNAGGTGVATFNSFGESAGRDQVAVITGSDDLYIAGDLEVDGTAYLNAYSSPADIAEVLQTKQSRENEVCKGDIGCLKESTTDNLNYGDVICIDTKEAKTITKCTESNSHLVVGVISNTTVLFMGEENGYPIAVAGITYTHVTNENGNVRPGDLLVSSSKPGYAMKNNAPKDGTVLGKAFDFCDKDDCTILMFVALS